MEGHCSTGQSPRQAVVPMKEKKKKKKGRRKHENHSPIIVDFHSGLH
jgi:hypothetical protein